MNRAERRERLAPVVHAMTGVALISQGLGNLGDPSSPAPLVVLPLIGGGLAVASVVRHRRRHQPSPLAEIASSMVEGLTCAVVGVASASRGTHYIQYAWFFAAVAVIGAGLAKYRRSRIGRKLSHS